MATRLCLSALPRLMKQTTPSSSAPLLLTLNTSSSFPSSSSSSSSSAFPFDSSSPMRRSFSVSASALAVRLFSEKHEWVLIDGGVGIVGVSSYAQEALGDIVYAQLPEIDAELEAEEECGALESVKAASEVYTPVGGVVTEINEALADNPGMINASPYGEGWLFKLKVGDDVETGGLMDDAAYEEFLKSQDH